MGGGGYSSTSRIYRTENFSRRSMAENFQERTMNLAMNPHGVGIRESRDSEEHPNSLAIILALDVTGSMGSIPQFIVGKGLPHFMDSIIKGGVLDPQVLFTAIGDHECDNAPLQVGQFESSDELLDHWLTKLYIEGNGGGNDGESYLLAWYFAAYHTAIDCMEKRNQKGFLFTIGDEPTLREVPKRSLKQIMGKGQYENFSSTDLLSKAKEKYHVFHLHLKQGSNGESQEVMDGWKQLMGDNLIIIDRKEEVSDVMSSTIVDLIGLKKLSGKPINGKNKTTPQEEEYVL